jgi:hypothetical protein
MTKRKEAEGRRREEGDGKKGRQEEEFNGRRKERGRKCRYNLEEEMGGKEREKKIIRREDGGRK